MRRKSFELDDQIMSLLTESDRPMGGIKIANRLGDSGKPVNPTLVYRALNRLLEQGCLCKVETISAYGIKPDQQSLALICTRCNDCRFLPASRSLDQLNHLARNHGFQARRSIIEVKGRCGQCSHR